MVEYVTLPAQFFMTTFVRVRGLNPIHRSSPENAHARQRPTTWPSPSGASGRDTPESRCGQILDAETGRLGRQRVQLLSEHRDVFRRCRPRAWPPSREPPRAVRRWCGHLGHQNCSAARGCRRCRSRALDHPRGADHRRAQLVRRDRRDDVRAACCCRRACCTIGRRQRLEHAFDLLERGDVLDRSTPTVREHTIDKLACELALSGRALEIDTSDREYASLPFELRFEAVDTFAAPPAASDHPTRPPTTEIAPLLDRSPRFTLQHRNRKRTQPLAVRFELDRERQCSSEHRDICCRSLAVSSTVGWNQSGDVSCNRTFSTVIWLRHHQVLPKVLKQHRRNRIVRPAEAQRPRGEHLRAGRRLVVAHLAEDRAVAEARADGGQHRGAGW